MLARLRLGTALSLGFGALLAFTLAIGVAAWLGLRGVQRGTVALSDSALPKAHAVARLDRALADAQRSINALFVPRLSQEVWKTAWARLDECLTIVQAARKEWETAPSDPGTAAAWNQLVADEERWDAGYVALAEALRARDGLVRSGRPYESKEVKALEAIAWPRYDALRRLIKTVDGDLVELRAAMQAEAGAHSAAARSASRRAELFLEAVVAIAVACAAALAIALTRHIRRSIADVAAQADRLSAAVQQGTLDVRGDVAAVHFEFAGVVEGMNRTMDAFTGPMRVAASTVDGIARGHVPPRIEAEYRGEFEHVKRSLNSLIDMVERRGRDIDALIAAAVAGRLDERADVGAYEGGNARVIDGMNRMLDAVTRPLAEARQVLDALARRDLRARMAGAYEGAYGDMKRALNASADALHDALAQVAQAAGQVSSASTQIASTSQGVASGASEQASSLEETGSSLESMSSTTRQAADHAQQAAALAMTARSAAADGSAAMEQMTGAMGRIKTSAQGTSQIIKDINEIAFQTNLLALNAAVEAARAGEAGRGFAVVAEEVRSLALRSKDAANKTEELIRESLKEAGEGEVTAQRVNGKLSEIVGAVSKVTDIVAEIAALTKEQAAGIEQVNKAVAQMNTVTQHNAASSEESSSAAAQLSAQAEELAAMVGAFQLNAAASAPRPAVPRRTAAIPQKRPPRAPRNGHAAQLAPEQVIPLDADISFKEF